MQKITNLSTIALFSILFLCSSHFVFAQKVKMSKQDKATMKKLMKTDWETKNIEKNGEPIDVNAIAGEVYMYFYTMKEKQKGTKRKKKVNKWKMEFGGQERIFNYTVKGDSIAFEGVKGWNDLKIINLEADRLTVDQLQDGSIIRWNMIPKKKEEIINNKRG